MKKKSVFVLVLTLAFTLAGCVAKTIKGNEVYSFPEPTKQITGSFYSQGATNDFVIGTEEYNPDDLSVMSVIEWFYNLNLRKCEKPEDVEGGEYYSFEINGETVFGYQDRGGDEAYIIASNTWYKVKNPSVPPIDPQTYFITLKEILVNEVSNIKVTHDFYPFEITRELNNNEIAIIKKCAVALDWEQMPLGEGETPDNNAGGEAWVFNINDGEITFTYVYQGVSSAILIDSEWYAVKNPSNPPVEVK